MEEFNLETHMAKVRQQHSAFLASQAAPVKLKNHPTQNDGYLDTAGRKAGRAISGTTSWGLSSIFWVFGAMGALGYGYKLLSSIF